MDTNNRFNWSTVDGHLVLKQDFSNLQGTDLIKVLSESHTQIKEKGSRNIIVVTNVNKVLFDHQVVSHFAKIMEFNKPYVSASAIYNAGSLQKAAIESTAQIMNRNFLIFHDDKSVQNWLETL